MTMLCLRVCVVGIHEVYVYVVYVYTYVYSVCMLD